MSDLLREETSSPYQLLNVSAAPTAVLILASYIVTRCIGWPQRCPAEPSKELSPIPLHFQPQIC
jgi:hypothetical protein